MERAEADDSRQKRKLMMEERVLVAMVVGKPSTAPIDNTYTFTWR